MIVGSAYTQPTFTSSKLPIKTLKHGVGICSKITIKTPERRHSGLFIVNFEHISHLALVFLLITFKMILPAGQELIFTSMRANIHDVKTLTQGTIKCYWDPSLRLDGFLTSCLFLDQFQPLVNLFTRLNINLNMLQMWDFPCLTATREQCVL